MWVYTGSASRYLLGPHTLECSNEGGDKVASINCGNEASSSKEVLCVL